MEKICTICNCVINDNCDFKVENTKGELVDVCPDCYYKCEICNASGVKITPMQSRKSRDCYHEPLARSYIDTHAKDFSKDFLTGELLRKERLTKETCVYFDEETQKVRVKKALIYKNSGDLSNYACQHCGKRFYFNYCSRNANNVNYYILEKLLNEAYCCNECKKTKNIKRDFLSGSIYECEEFEGKNIRKSKLKEFLEGGFFNRLRSYHTAPPLIPITKAKKFKDFAGFGFELETETPTNYELDDYDNDDNAKELINDLQKCFANIFYYNTDGSLNDTGVEIITRPADYEFWKNFNFEKFSEILENNGRISGRKDGASDCGMHIHVSRQMFGKLEDERTFNIAKILLFFKKYEKELEKFGGRPFGHFCEEYYLETNLDALKIAINKCILLRK